MKICLQTSQISFLLVLQAHIPAQLPNLGEIEVGEGEERDTYTQRDIYRERE